MGQPRIYFFLMQNETLHQTMQLQTSHNALLQTAATQSGNSRNKLLLVFKKEIKSPFNLDYSRLQWNSCILFTSKFSFSIGGCL